jgi:outer membrane protein
MTTVLPSAGQVAPPAGPVTIEQAINSAAKNFPAIRADDAEIDAATAGVQLSKTAFLPSADFHYQINRATRNNVFGLMFPNATIAPISGPALPDQTGTSTFGTAVGLSFGWEPFDFGLRKANVAVAQKVKEQTEAGRTVREFEVSLAATNAFFSALAAHQAVEAAHANVERMEVFTSTVGVLVKAELRPGADESRARAELIRARNELIAAEKLEREARLELGRWMGLAGSEIELVPGTLLSDPPTSAEGASTLDRHPLTARLAAGVEVVRARRESVAKEYRPKFEVLSSVYGRGTGARLDGTFEGGGNGLYPNVGNWAVGMGVSFPIFDYKQNRVRQDVESHREAAEAARLTTVVEELKSEVAKARVDIDASRQVAANMPEELSAARALEQQAQARYKAGLGNVVEVADAQRLLRQAETDEALARLSVWRALFGLAAAEGDMTELLAQASR